MRLEHQRGAHHIVEAYDVFPGHELPGAHHEDLAAARALAAPEHKLRETKERRSVGQAFQRAATLLGLPGTALASRLDATPPAGSLLHMCPRVSVFKSGPVPSLAP